MQLQVTGLINEKKLIKFATSEPPFIHVQKESLTCVHSVKFGKGDYNLTNKTCANSNLTHFASDMNRECNRTRLEETVAKLKAVCRSHGVSGVRDLGNTLCIYDANDPGTLSYAEFRKGMREFGLWNCPEDETLNLFNCLDYSGTGKISSDDLMDLVRQPMSRWRTSIVEKVFCMVDQDHDGLVTVNDLKVGYNYKKHPKFQNGDWTCETLFDNLVKHFLPSSSAQQRDGIVSRREFIDFYAGLSLFISRDVEFDYIVRYNWKI